jgi:hypothetical protein
MDGPGVIVKGVLELTEFTIGEPPVAIKIWLPRI